MKFLSFLLLSLASLTLAPAAPERQILAEDDASNPPYKEGWKSSGGGTGFGDWTFQSLQEAGAESHAGFFLAEAANQPDLHGAALQGKAFGLFANGIRFEVATAFRPLKKPLAVGQTFSLLMEHGPSFTKRFAEDDPATGSIGFTLRTGQAAGSVEDYNHGARFEFGAYEGQANYQIYDGTAEQDSGIPLQTGGLSVSFTLVTADTYELEVTTLADHKTTTLKDRHLGGDPGAALESFCIFNRDGEKSDAYFNGFQILSATP